MLEPLGVAHNGIERLDVKDEDVLVIGCGPVGLLAQKLAKVMGAKRSVLFLSINKIIAASSTNIIDKSAFAHTKT